MIHFLFNTYKFLILFLLVAIPSCLISQNIKEMIIVTDDNYPPYIFRDKNGRLNGIIVDLWNLWEKENNIRVNIVGMDWSKAKKFMADGKADVIETFFYTEERAKEYLFTKPYATIDVPIFVNKSISELDSIEKLQGLKIGVKTGDASIDELKKYGLFTLVEFNNYEEIILAAKDRKIYAFCVDAPPAYYYLEKYNLSENFKNIYTLYIGKFHRAVKKSDSTLLVNIENGFSRIDEKKVNSVFEKWLSRPDNFVIKMPSSNEFITSLILIVCFVALSLIISLLIVRRQRKKYYAFIQEFREKEQIYKAIMDNSPALIYLKDLDGKYTYVNKQFLTILSAQESDVIGKRIDEIGNISHIDEKFFNIGEKTVVEEVKKVIIEEELTLYNNKHHYLSVKFPLQYFDGKVYGVGSISTEITDRIENEKQLKLIAEELNESNRSKDKFFSIIAHDLKNPLQGLLGFSEILNDEFENLPTIKIKNYITSLNNLAKNINQLTENLLQWSRLQTGKISISKSTINLNDEVNSIKDLFIGLLIKKSQSLVIDFKSEIILNTDENLLRSILQNLVSNAIKFTPIGGQIKIGAEKLNNFVLISVKDNGIGMTEQDLESIFKLDKQITRRGTENEKGTGIGLILCKEMVQKLNGRIWVESMIEKGSTFYITLPTE